MSIPSFEPPRRVCRPRRPERTIFDFPTAQSSLPLIRRILADLQAARVQRGHLECRFRRLAPTPETSAERRRLTEEAQAARRRVHEHVQELQRLGTAVLDVGLGILGFPTIVNGGLAYLVYSQEDDAIRHWRYRDQPKLRPIPEQWRSDVLQPSRAEGLSVS